jgi:hypothetical protein
MVMLGNANMSFAVAVTEVAATETRRSPASTVLKLADRWLLLVMLSPVRPR